MILPLFFLFTAVLAKETPLEQLIREVIAQTNNANLQNHRDVLEINGFSYNDFVILELGKISVSNFSTIALIGTPEVKEIRKEDGTNYYFDLAVGLEILEVDLDYKFSSPFFYSSGKVTIKNTGHALQTRGVVNTYNGKKSCNAVLQAVEIQSLGSLDVDFGQAGIFNWIFSRLIGFAYRMGDSYVRPMINQLVADKVQASEFQTLFSQLACTPFAF